jgi:prepilin-type processing-associated H-X9-DG protein
MPSSDFRFTLRSLLAVVTICCVLLAILFPAIQLGRERYRRTQCSVNLYTYGFAFSNFESIHGHLPPGMTGDDTNQFGWGAYVLPYLDENGLATQMKATGVALQFEGGPVRGTNNIPASAVPLAKRQVQLFLCPSSSLPRTDNDGYGASHYCGNAGNAFADYGCSAFPGKLQNGCLLFANDNTWTEVVSLNDITDGLENTILVGEVGVSQDVSATKTDHGCFPIWAGGNNDGGCSAWNMGSCLRLVDREFSPNLRRGQESNLSFGSGHPGGANFALADGSVRWIENDIDLDAWRRLGSRNDGEGEARTEE